MTGRPQRHVLRTMLLALVLPTCTGTAPLGHAAPAPAANARVAILNDSLPGMDSSVTAAVAESLRRAGFQVANLSADEVCDPAVLSPQKFFLYVIPNAKSYPAAAGEALARFVQAKGHLLVLGTSPFGSPVWKHQNQWIGQLFMRQAIAQHKPDHMAFDFDRLDQPADWTRSGKGDQPPAAEIVRGGADGSAGCLKITLNYQSGSPDGMGGTLPQGSVSGPGLLCFWAKGDGQTAQLAVRLIQGDGPQDRGIAVIRITKNWAYYVLRPEDFRQIGQADPAKAKRVCFELIDRRITSLVAEGRHTVYVDQLGIAADPFAAVGGLTAEPFPLIETISPGYKVYPLSDIASLKVRDNQAILAAAQTLPVPREAFSSYRRPEGKGLEKGYRWRWIPLVQALDSAGQERGTAVWMLLNQAPLNEGPDFEDAALRGAFREVDRHLHQPTPAEGSICAMCAIADPASLKQVAQTDLLGALAQRMRNGVFLSHAGSQEFSYWPGEDVRLGAVVANYGLAPATLRVRIRVAPAEGGQPLFTAEPALAVEPGAKGKVSVDWPAPKLTGERYTVTTELLQDGKTIDVIAHEMGVLHNRQPARDEFITARDGEFWLRGQKWHPIGVNYWPRSAIALESLDYTYHWLTPGYYDPEQVEQELAQLESMGANLVCIRAHHRNDRRTLLDFLRRCRNHHIYAFLFAQTHAITVEPHYFQGIMMPIHFQDEAVAEFIRGSRLADNPAIFAWDTIWEPAGWVFGGVSSSHGWREPTPYRQRWDADWARWIDQRYGSLAAAEADWGAPAPRVDGRVTSPSNEQFSKDGPWRVMVCAYRRFMDDLMSRKWNDASRKLRQLDPNHLVSFRQGNLGPFDFTLTATPKHVDFVAMEGYNFQPGEVGPNVAGFVNRYLHFTTRGKPFFWAEFGSSAWDRGQMRPTADKLASQADCHELIYRAALENGANGASPWWWGGGYRVCEQSDFGILNPDGTPRPSAELLRDYAPRFRARPGYPAADTWFSMDRDAHAGSHRYVAFNDGAQAFQSAAAARKKLGIRTPATGTTSVDTPLVAVGNTQYNGHNPPKYLDAEFNWFKIKIGDGPWIEVLPGAQIRVPKNLSQNHASHVGRPGKTELPTGSGTGSKSTPILAVASVGNIQEATWLTPASAAGKPGAVYLASTEASALKVKQPITRDTVWQQDADFGDAFRLSDGISTETRIELQMTADGRAWFGEKMSFTLVP